MAGAIVALCLVPAGALAAGTTVTVRVEGARRTLLAPKTVHTHSGSITRFGAPHGSCPALDAVGALQLATKGDWGGKYSSSLGGDEVLSIFGERYSFSSTHYWGFWVNNRYASFGICQQKLKAGDTLLFAPAPDKGSVYPTAIRAPRTAQTNHRFEVRVVAFTTAGRARPLARARVTVGRISATTNAAGYVGFTARNAGRYRLTATEKGYIRPVPVTVTVA